MTKRTATQCGDVLILQTAKSFTVFAVRIVSANGQVAFAEIQLDIRSNNLPKGAPAAIHDAILKAAG